MVLNCLACSLLKSQSTDIRWLRTIQTTFSENSAKYWNYYSESAYPVCIVTPIALWTYGKLNKNKLYQKNAYYIAVSELLTMSSVFVFKKIIDRPRPYSTYSDIQFLEKQTDSSMPSGHTSAAFAAATSLTLSYPKWYIYVPSYLWASSIAYSRMYLGHHYPSDVFAGVLLGSASAVGTFYLNKLIFKPKK